MRSDRQLSASPLRQWFTLEELLEAVLNDVISVDARFQLRQAEAWRNFARSLSHLDGLAHLTSADFTVGFGRLENLGLGQLDFNLSLDVKGAGWWRRLWWGTLKLFGVKPKPHPAFYRLADARHQRGGRVELCVQVVRDKQGRWQVQQRQPAPPAEQAA